MNKHTNEEIRITDLFHAVCKRRKMILIFTIVGLIIGMLFSVVSYMRGEMSKQYAITSSFAVTSITEDGLFTTKTNNPNSTDIYLAENMVDSVIYVMRSDRVLNAAIARLNLLGVTARDISDNLSMKQYNETQIVEMTLYWRSAEEGVEILDAINSVAPDILIETLKIGGVSVVNEPRSRYIIGGSMNVTLWGLLAAVGLLIGAFISILELFLWPKLINLKDVGSILDLEVIGEIPQNKAYFSEKHALPDTECPDAALFSENYASTAHILRNYLGDKTHQCIYVTSTGTNEGKTNVVANLAYQLSELEHKVLLIDLDIHNPCLAGQFGRDVAYPVSLNAIYRGDSNVNDAIMHLTGHLDLLPTLLEQTALPIDDALLSLIRSLTKQYDYVLIDTPPVGCSADMLNLNRVAQAALMVIRYDMYTISEIRAAVGRLEKSGIKVIGSVVTDVHKVGQKRSSGYYSERPQTTVSHRQTEPDVKAPNPHTSIDDTPEEDTSEEFTHQFSWPSEPSVRSDAEHEQPGDLPPTTDIAFRILSGEKHPHDE